MKPSHVAKRWGWEETLHLGEYMAKLLFIRKGETTSAHYHEKKTETLTVLTGALEVRTDTEITLLTPGSSMTLLKDTYHRMIGQSDCTYVEASGPYPEDSVRVCL